MPKFVDTITFRLSRISYNITKIYNLLMKKTFLCAIVIACMSNSSLKAQLLSINTSSASESSKNSESPRDWSIFTDGENRMIYVDFEKINVNLSSVAVKDTEGKIIFKDETLWQLPVNTIYEIDFSKYPKGTYAVELKTFTSVLKKNVTIN